MLGLLLVGALFDQGRARVQRADEVHADVRRAGPGGLLVEDQLLGRRRAAAAVLLRPVQARVPGVEQAALPVGVPLAALGPRVARRLRRAARAASRRATRAARHGRIRRRPSSAAPRSGESTSAAASAESASTNAVRVVASQSHDSRYRRWPSASRSWRLRPKKNSSCHQRRPGARPRRVARSSTTGRSPTRYTVRPSTTMRWRHCSQSAKHIDAGKSSAEVVRARTRARSSPPWPRATSSRSPSSGGTRPPVSTALALPCATERLSAAREAVLKGISRITVARDPRPIRQEHADMAAELPEDHQRRRPRRRARAPLRALAARRSSASAGPHVERRGIGTMRHIGGGAYEQTFDDDGPKADCWVYEDLVYINKRHVAAVGFDRDDMTMSPITYDEMRPGCYDPKARLDDMDMNWVEASLCFPTFPRFCGQTFLEAKDRELARGVRARVQRLDGRGVVRRQRRPPHPAHAHPAVGRRARGRRGAAQRGARRARGVLQRDPAASSGCRRSTPATGIRSSPRARRRTPSSACTSVRRRRCRRRRPTRRSRSRRR